MRDDSTGFSVRDGELLAVVAREYEIPNGIVAKLLDLQRDMHGMGRRAGIYEKIDAIFREDWPAEELPS